MNLFRLCSMRVLCHNHMYYLQVNLWLRNYPRVEWIPDNDRASIVAGHTRTSLIRVGRRDAYIVGYRKTSILEPAPMEYAP